jgi:predicted GIY-YIG superfamily endonuclease
MISLPQDLEAFADDYDQLTGAAVYALDLTPPDGVTDAWDERFDERPDYWDRLTETDEWIYVGASGSVLARLEDHRDAEVRKSILPTLATDMDLRNVWFYGSAEKAFERESAIGIRLRQHLPETTFVHWR